SQTPRQSVGPMNPESGVNAPIPSMMRSEASRDVTGRRMSRSARRRASASSAPDGISGRRRLSPPCRVHMALAPVASPRRKERVVQPDKRRQQHQARDEAPPDEPFLHREQRFVGVSPAIRDPVLSAHAHSLLPIALSGGQRGPDAVKEDPRDGEPDPDDEAEQ